MDTTHKEQEMLNKVHVFPNPFSHQINLSIQVAKSTTLSITVFNTQGQQVRTIRTPQQIDSGTHSIVFDSEGLEAGMYQVQIRTDQWVTTQKIIKI